MISNDPADIAVDITSLEIASLYIQRASTISSNATIGSIFRLHDLCSPSGYEPFPPEELPLLPPQEASESPDGSVNPNTLAILSVLSEGGEEQENCLPTPCKDNSNNCQPDLVFQSETNYIEHLGNVQQAFIIVSNTSETDNNTIEDIASLQHCSMMEAQPISVSAEDFIPEPINEHALIKMKNISIKQTWIDKSIAEMESLLKENTFSLDIMPDANEAITPTRFVYKAKLKSDGSLEKCKARLVVRGDLQAEIPGEGWSPTAPFRLLRRLLAESARTARTIKQLGFISAFVQASVKERLFVKLPICLKDHFPPTMTKYFGRP